MKILAEQTVFKYWKITSQQAEKLISNLENERLKKLSYLNVGKSSLYFRINPGQEKHNYLTWCKEH